MVKCVTWPANICNSVALYGLGNDVTECVPVDRSESENSPDGVTNVFTVKNKNVLAVKYLLLEWSTFYSRKMLRSRRYFFPPYNSQDHHPFQE